MSLIGLPHAYRFVVLNSHSSTISATDLIVEGRRAKLNTDGSLVYEGSNTTVYSSTSALATGGYAAGSAVSNATDLYMGGEFIFRATVSDNVSGDVVLFLQHSVDDETTFPTVSGGGRPVAVINFVSGVNDGGEQIRSFEL